MVNNQVLIKNYNLSEFIKTIDMTFQDIQMYMLKRNEENCFGAYMVDYTWKIIQVKLALMVRQLNWKVIQDRKEKEEEFKIELKK